MNSKLAPLIDEGSYFSSLNASKDQNTSQISI